MEEHRKRFKKMVSLDDACAMAGCTLGAGVCMAALDCGPSSKIAFVAAIAGIVVGVASIVRVVATRVVKVECPDPEVEERSGT